MQDSFVVALEMYVRTCIGREVKNISKRVPDPSQTHPPLHPHLARRSYASRLFSRDTALAVYARILCTLHGTTIPRSTRKPTPSPQTGARVHVLQRYVTNARCRGNKLAGYDVLDADAITARRYVKPRLRDGACARAPDRAVKLSRPGGRWRRAHARPQS